MPPGPVLPKVTLMNKKLYTFPAHDWAKAVADLNVDLLHIRNWCFESRLLLNHDKTKLIVYGSRQRLQNLLDFCLSLLGKETNTDARRKKT